MNNPSLFLFFTFVLLVVSVTADYENSTFENSTLQVSEIKSTSVILKWKLPLNDTTSNNVTFSIFINNTLLKNTTETNYEVNELLKNTTYKFKVCYRDLTCIFAIIRTLVKDKAPSLQWNLSVVNISATSALVQWENPKQANGVILGYNIRICANRTFFCTKNQTSDVTYNFTDLMPYINYTVYINAYTNVSKSNEGNKTFLTLESTPSLPWNLSVVKLFSSYVLFQWEIPQKTNGVILGYNVRFCMNNAFSCIKNQTTDQSYNFTELFPYTNYTFYVSAYNAASESVEISQTIKTLESAPSAPMNLSVVTLSATSVLFNWEKPKQANGVLLGYSVRICMNKTFLCIKNQTTDQSYNFTELFPYTNYTFYVIAYNAASESVEISQTIKTLESAPSAPMNLSVVTMSATSVFFIWGKPKQANGVLLGYSVRICMNKTFLCIKNQTTVQSYNFTELFPYTNYTFYVNAYNAASESVEISQTIKTLESAPSAPMNLSVVTISATSVFFVWEKPKQANGVLLGYSVRICMNKTFLCIKNQTTDQSYNFTELFPYTNYTFYVSAYNAASESVEISQTIKTLESVPGPVEKLKIVGYTSNTINITWMKPNVSNGNVFYRIYYKEEKKSKIYTYINETNSFFASILELEEFIMYHVYVQAFTRQGGNSEDEFVSQRTNAILPSGIPVGFSAMSISSTSINLTWNPVEFYARNGIIQSYIINFTSTSVKLPSIKESYVVKGLKKYTSYQFKIYVENQIGVAQTFALAENRTLEDTPNAPASFSCHPKSSAEIVLNWSPPNETNGILLGYEITQFQNNLQFKLSNKQLQYTDNDLTPFRLYDYVLHAFTEIGFGLNRTVSCKTNETVPNSPHDLKYQILEAYWFSIVWDEPLDKLGNIISYEVVIFTGKPANTMLDKYSLTEKSLNISKQIVPYEFYTIRVAALTVIGKGDFAEITVTTKESTPSPIETISTYIKSTSVELYWSQPKHPNGKLFYKIFIKSLNDPETLLDDRFQERQYLQNGLKEFTNYTFTVLPYTLGGKGVRKIVSVKTDSALPSGKVNDLMSQPINSTAVKLSWNPLSLESRNGVIDFYKISYNDTDKTFEIEKDADDEIDKEFTIVISKLRKYFEYRFFISAHNDKGFGPEMETVVRTNGDVPGPPILSENYKSSAESIEISWLPPVEINGLLQSYILKYMPANGQDATKVKRLGKAIMKSKIDELEPYTEYKVSLEATTEPDNKPGKPDIKFYWTNISAPDGPPLHLRHTSKNSTSVSLSWDHPTKPNGKLVYYSVVLYEERRLHKQASVNVTKYTFTDLKPYTSYNFAVAFIGEYGFNSVYSSQKNVVTDVSSPPLPPTVLPPSFSPKSYKEITISLWIASDINGPIKFYYIIVVEGQVDSKGLNMAPSKKPNDYSTSDFVTYEEAKENNMNKPYIAAVVKPSEIDNKKEFRIGDGSVSSKQKLMKEGRKRRNSNQNVYVNGPLSAEKTYFVFQRAYVDEKNFVSSKSWMGPFETIAKPVTPTTPNNGGAIAGALVTVVLLIGIIIAAVFIFRKGHFCPPTEKVKINEEVVGLSNTAFSSETDGHMAAAGPIRVEGFSAYVRNLSKDEKYLFSEEFKQIQAGRSGLNSMFEHSNHPINREKNRYNNIVAYDHTRVLLKPIIGVHESDYINANYIDGFNRQGSYIATQGPLEGTFEDFWRMCWEQSVNSIVMLTRLEENGRIKCHQYWPEVGSICYGSMQVTLTESFYFPSFIKRTFSLLHEEYPGTERFVTHFSLLTWNDHSIANSQECLKFIRRVNQGTPESGGPVVVHCSAGVGRTGTYIALDVNLRRIEREGKIEIFNYLQHIRSQRNYMVQTEAQYIFIHDTLLEFLTFGVTEVQARDLRDYTKRLQQPTDAGGVEMNVDKEFHKLNLFDQSTLKTMHAANASCNKNKNRFLNVLPFDDTRVTLRQLPGIQGSDYINANYIHGYSHVKQFVATQAPLPQTIPSFWRMIWEHHCMTIVCLAQENEGGKVKIHRYWPSIEASIHGPLMVEMVNEETFNDFIVREFKVTHTTEGHSRTVKHFQYVSWPDNSYPDSASGLVDLIGRVQKWHQRNSVGQIVVHCSAGVGRTGVFIALCNMIERVRVEGVVDVFQTVRELRTQRPAMVQTKAQYLFLYLALQDFLTSFDIYQTFQ